MACRLSVACESNLAGVSIHGESQIAAKYCNAFSLISLEQRGQLEIVHARSFGPLENAGPHDDGRKEKMLGLGFRFRHADHHGAAARQFFVGDFRDESQVQPKTRAFLICDVIEEINDVSTKAIFDATAFLKIKRTGGIHFELRRVAQNGAQFALEIKRSLPHLRHGQSDNVIGHISNRAWQEGAWSVQCRLSDENRAARNSRARIADATSAGQT